MDSLKHVIHPIHREGYIFILGFAIITFFLAIFSSFFAYLGLIATAWCVYFFRDPVRYVPEQDGLVVAPGDGVVQRITTAPLPKEVRAAFEGGEDDADAASGKKSKKANSATKDKEYTRISIFLSVFDVHVNRIPVAGKIVQNHYHPGKFFNASLDKASQHNERQAIVIETKDGKQITCVQIAGLVARRIVCDAHLDEEFATGDRYGIIRFGSRMDVYLPEGVSPLVAEGQRAVGGETILADLNSSASARQVRES